MLRRLGVRRKILATLAVPVLVLLLGATFLSLDALERSRVSGLQRDFSLATRAQDATLEALQAERDLSIRLVHGDADVAQALVSARARTDTTVAGLNQAFKDVDPGNVEPAVVAAIQEAGRARSAENMRALRAIVDRDNPDLEASVQSGFNNVISGQLNVATSLAAYADDRNLARYVDNYAQTSIALNHLRLEAVVGELLNQDYMVSEHTQGQLRSAAVMFAEGESVTARAKDAVTRLGLVDYPTVTARYTSVRQAILIGNPREANLEARLAWPEMVGVEVAELAETRDVIREATIAEGARIDNAVTRQTVLTIVGAIAAVVLSIAVALLIARQITEPLKRLTEAAKKVRADLPSLVEQVAVPGQGPALAFESIAVETDDEIGELANAFNEVNATTLDVARQQALLRGSIAEMFINVARRDQVLLNRQLSFLDDLERAEEDPTTLANLFRLDHLATRMRRNAESLLVLAGIESGRRVRQPMPLSDVVRTAASEIDQYDRIDLEITTDPLMLGHNALAAAHLLAELLENATVFSEPGTPVTVSTAEDARWVTITVVDEGLGMSQDELDDANEKAATYAAGEIVGASRLGLYVVGRLAYKLGASVRLAKAPEGTGTVARVMLPRALFAESVPLEAPTDPLAPETRAATEAWVAPEIEPDETPLPSRIVEPEAPVGIPVDLDALTNGATGAGMPRRRTRAADPAAQAPSSAFSEQEEREIVLPPLQAAELPQEFASAAEEWRPIASPTMGPVGLPSREPRAEVAPVAEVAAPAAETSAPQRAGMFSNFRARKEFEMLEEARRAKAAGAAVPADAAAQEAVASAADQEADREGPAITLAASRVAGWVGTEQQGEPLARRRAPKHEDDEVQVAEVVHDAPPAELSDEMVIPDLVPDDDEPAVVEPVWSPVMETATEAPLTTSDSPAEADEAPFVPQFQLGAPLAGAPAQPEQASMEAAPVEHAPSAAGDVTDADPFGLAAMAVEASGWSPELASGGMQNLADSGWEHRESPVAPTPDVLPTGAHVGSVASAEDLDDAAPLTRRARRARHADAAGFTAPSVPTPSGVGFDFLPQEEDGTVVAPSGYTAPSAGTGTSAPTAYSAHEAASYPPPPAAQPFEPAPVAYDAPAVIESYAPAEVQPAEAPVEPAWSYPPAAAEAPAPAQAAVDQSPTAPAPWEDAAPSPAPWEAPAPVATTQVPSTLSFDEAISRRSDLHESKAKPKRGLFKRKPKRDASSDVAPAPTAPSAPGGLASSAVFEPLAPMEAAPQERALDGSGFGNAWGAPTPAPGTADLGYAPAEQYQPPAFAPGAPLGAPAAQSAPSPFEPQPAATLGYQPAAAYEPPAPESHEAPADAFSDGFSYNPSGWAPPAEPAPMALRSHTSPAPAESAPTAAAPAAAPGASWTTGRSIDAELSARLALQAGIQEQALAELSQLSSYRPNQQVADTTSALTKRVRTEVPSTTVEDDMSKKISRDAAELRTRLSAFMSATSRARDGAPSGPEASPGTAFTPDPAPQSR